MHRSRLILLALAVTLLLAVVAIAARGRPLGAHAESLFLFDGDRIHYAPAFPVHAIDTTGAGDVFRGGFIYALVHRLPMDEALRTANAAAAVSCTRLGALNGVPSLAEVRDLMAANVHR